MRQTTKEAIAEAFLKLLDKQTIDKITVKDIVAECGVNRQTFYYHFGDIYDLMEWTLASQLHRYEEEYPVESQDWQELIRQLFSFFYSNRKSILHGYDAMNHIRYERIILKWVEPVVKKRIELCSEAEAVPAEKKQFVCKVFTRIAADLIFDWIGEGMPNERQVNLEDYFTLVNGSLNVVLERFGV